jgi:hypothetical protein
VCLRGEAPCRQQKEAGGQGCCNSHRCCLHRSHHFLGLVDDADINSGRSGTLVNHQGLFPSFGRPPWNFCVDLIHADLSGRQPGVGYR